MGRFTEKRRRKAAKRRGEEVDYTKKRSDDREKEANAMRERRLRSFADAKKLRLPEGYSLDDLKQLDPRVYARAEAGEAVSPSPKLDPKTNAIIWFNDLDRAHTFNLKYKIPRANVGLVLSVLGTDKAREIQPRILPMYALACLEHRDHPRTWYHRSLFLQYQDWTRQDIHVFTETQRNTLNKFVRELKAAVPEDDGAFSNFAGDMENAMDEVTKKEDAEKGQMNEEGEDFAAHVPQDQVPLNMVFRNPNDEIEEGLQWFEAQRNNDPGEEYFREHHGDFVDMCLNYCGLLMEDLMKQTPRPKAHLRALHRKVVRLEADRDLRKLATEFRFEGYE